MAPGRVLAGLRGRWPLGPYATAPSITPSSLGIWPTRRAWRGTANSRRIFRTGALRAATDHNRRHPDPRYANPARGIGSEGGSTECGRLARTLRSLADFSRPWPGVRRGWRVQRLLQPLGECKQIRGGNCRWRAWPCRRYYRVCPPSRGSERRLPGSTSYPIIQADAFG